MDFQKVIEAIERSPQEIKDLLFSEEVGKFLNQLAKENNLDEEKSLLMVDEIGYVILGLKERSAIKNSLQNIGIPASAVLSIIQEINRKIFTELDKYQSVTTISSESKEGAMKRLVEKRQMTGGKPRMPIQKVVKVPEIKPENLPMVEKGEVAHEVPHVETPTPPAPSALPPTPSKPVQPTKSAYAGGQDPYREPLG